RLRARDDAEKVAAEVAPVALVHRQRHPDLGLGGWKCKARGHHADNGGGQAVKCDGAAEHVLTAEYALPEAMAEHGDAIVPLDHLRGLEPAAENRLHLQ